MRLRPARVQASAFALLIACTGCNYLALLRPSVLRLLNPRMVALVNELPNVDHQNKEIIGQLFAQGGRGVMFYQGPITNPGVEVNVAVGGRLMCNVGRSIEVAA